MAEKKRILLIGGSVMELSLNMYRLPTPGESLTDDGGVAYLPSGADAPTAAALARLGVSCALCSRLGADFHGQRLFEFYKSREIVTSYMKVDRDYPTGLSVCIKEGVGEPRRLYYPGANEHLTAENVAEAFSFAPDGVMIGHGVPFATRLSAMKLAAGQGVPILMTADGLADSTDTDLLPTADILYLDDRDVFKLTGLHAGSMTASLQAAAKLSKRISFRYLIIRLGARGTFLYQGTRYDQIPPYGSYKRTPDMTGIDECFTAALALSYVTDPSSVQKSIAFASAAAAYAVAKGGGWGAFPAAAELSEFLSRG